MLKKVVGILAFLAFLSFISVGSLLMSQGRVMFDGPLVQIALANLTAVVVLCGFHLIETHCTPGRLARLTIWSLGLILLVYGALVSFDTVSIQANWNLVLSLAILFITLIQLQLLKWEKSKSILKIMGLLTILANAFLIVFFFAKLNMRSLEIVFDVCIVTSVFAFLVGLIFTRKKKNKAEPAQA